MAEAHPWSWGRGIGGERPVGWLNDLLSRYPIIIVVAVVAIYGFRREDFSEFSLLTQDPFITHPDKYRQFLHSSPLSLFIGWPLTHTFGAHASYMITFLGGMLFLIWSAHYYLSDKSAEHARLTLIVVLSTPLIIVLTRWFGKTDPYLLAFYLLLLRHHGQPIASAVLAALMVCAHKEIGMVMLATDALLRYRVRPPIVIGAAAGYGLVTLYLASLSAAPFSRIDLNISFLQQGLVSWARAPVAHVVFALGWFWWFLLGPSRPPNIIRIGVVVATCFALNLTAADFTRDFVLCAFPLIMFTAEHVARNERLSAMAAGGVIPLLFIVQIQMESFDRVHDVSTTISLEQALRDGHFGR